MFIIIVFFRNSYLLGLGLLLCRALYVQYIYILFGKNPSASRKGVKKKKKKKSVAKGRRIFQSISSKKEKFHHFVSYRDTNLIRQGRI